MSMNKKLITIALFACTFMGAVEITIVTTAIPSIVKDLSGFNLSSYVFSIYLLTYAIATTVFGKLSDFYGRKRLLQFSIVIFLIGSLMCGLSGSMPFLIISRAIQGLGSGAITTLTMATIGDVFAIEERAKIQGYNSTVWSIASLIAPVLGGAILMKFSWHWVFLINIPVGLLSIYFIEKSYHTVDSKSDEKLDVKGLAVLTIVISCMIHAMSSLEKNSFFSFNVLGFLSISLVLMAIFYKIEKSAESPVLPYKLFSKEILIIMIICFLNAMILIAMDVYNPSFMQSVQGYKPIISAVPIVPMSVFWVLSSFALSRIISKYTTRTILMMSLLILDIGLFGLVMLRPQSSPLIMALASAVIGFGFGGSFNMLLFIVQETLAKEDIGVASGSVMFIRTLGEILGISAFGLIVNHSISSYFQKIGLTVDTGSILANKALQKSDVVQALFGGYNIIYITCFLVGGACVLLTLLLPSKKKIGNY